MKITKEQVISALTTEPLAPGYFIRMDGKPLDTCEVCAVGAVMRNVLNKQINDKLSFDQLCEQVTLNQYIYEDTSTLLEEENYLGALSNYFEELLRDNEDDEFGDFLPATEEQRKKLINFVEETFPAEFEINFEKGE